MTNFDFLKNNPEFESFADRGKPYRKKYCILIGKQTVDL